MHRLFPLFLMALPLLPNSVSSEVVRFGLREAAPLVETTADGRLRGLEYELLAAIFAAAGMEIDAYVGSNARLTLAAGEGAVQGFAPVVGAAPDGLYLTDSYVTYHNVAVTLAVRGIVLERPSDLARWRVLAFQRASKVLGAEFAAAVAGAPDYREEPVQALQAKIGRAHV